MAVRRSRPRRESGLTTQPGVVELQSITVKGELQERVLQDVQTSVTVVSGDQLDVGVEKDLYDLIEKLPGVNMEPGGFGFVIRGIKTQGQNIGGGNAIAYKIDGVTVNDFQAIRQGPASIWDLEQVEVFKGPQSTQQGQNALAGAIVMRSKDPVDYAESKFRVDYGSFDEKRFAAAVNVPLNKEWAFRLSAEDYSNDGDIKHHITGEDIGDGSQETYRAKLRYNNHENFDAILSYSFNENFLASQGIIPDEWPERRVDTHRQARWAETDTASLLLKHDINERWSIESNTGYIQTDWFVRQDIEEGNPAANMFVHSLRASKGLTEEVKFRYNNGEDIRWVSGLYYADHQANVASSPSPGEPFESGESNDSTNKAFFTELEYDISDRWIGVFGIRYDDEERVFTSDLVDAEHSSTEWLPKVGVVYEIEDDRSIGFTAQRAYRAGGTYVNPLSFFDPSDDEVGSFDSEYTTNFEISYRSLLNEGRIKFNANVFFTEYTDMQLNSFTVDWVNFVFDSRVDNVGEAELFGGEIESAYRINEKLNVFLNLGYSNTDITADVASVGAAPGESNQGNRFPLAPELTGAIGAEYQLNRNWGFELSGGYTGDFYYSEKNLAAERNPSYFTVDAQLTYYGEKWSASVYARNMF
ncbi:MAG: TonB-dependent receptor, partial [Verrucomicrobiota bacterium]